MAKLLETRLPIAGSEITPDVFNRLVRVLELNLQKFDPNATLQITTEKKLTTKFNPGDIVFTPPLEIHTTKFILNSKILVISMYKRSKKFYESDTIRYELIK